MEPNDYAVPRPCERFVRLRSEAQCIVAELPGANVASFLPVPASRMDWLVAAAGRLWRQRRRCLAALLLAEPATGGWTIRIPRQQCGEAGVAWVVTVDDFSGLGPEWVLGGTFQATSREDGLPELVPAADGLHFVLVHGVEETQLRGFVRVAGVLQPAGERPVMLNDWKAVIDAAMPRLTLV